MYFYIFIVCLNTITSMINTNLFFDFTDFQATHQTLCFPNADQIILIKEGTIVFQGKYQDAKQVTAFSDMLGATDEHSGANEGANDTEVSAENIHVVADTADQGKISVYCTCWWYSLCNFQYRSLYENTCSYNFEC